MRSQALKNYLPVPESGCWLWLGSWDRNSKHGRITLYPGGRNHRRYEGAHRTFYRALVGPIPDGLCVCHKCDTPPCVNPDHLFLGTHLENMEDAARKGRYRNRPVRTKFSVEQLLEARRLIRSGMKQRDVSRETGISTAVLSNLKNNKIARVK